MAEGGYGFKLYCFKIKGHRGLRVFWLRAYRFKLLALGLGGSLQDDTLRV